MQLETMFKNKVLRLLDLLPIPIFYIKIQQVSKVGDPDIIMCVAGRFVAWELKVGDNKATKLQQYKLDKINEAGGIGRVVHPDNLDESINELLTLG